MSSTIYESCRVNGICLHDYKTSKLQKSSCLPLLIHSFIHSFSLLLLFVLVHALGSFNFECRSLIHTGV